MRLVQWIVVLLASLAMPVAAQAPSELAPVQAHAMAPASGGAASDPARGGAALTAADLNTWLDGFMPASLARGDIAGAVVVVVKDGQVLTQRGFGYADVNARRRVDPATTLFRPGSTSKLFTWTAVMQLVQAGKIDLDRDVNDYLDFKIPAKFGRPITMRNLMTHTAGFAETTRNLILYDPKRARPLGATMKGSVPARIYAPGAIPAYSNYGASLAGYIVERVSGEPFATYVQRHIFSPLGMSRSTFGMPLPPALAGSMSRGYAVASQDPKPFEIIELAPAGSLSATGADMGRFMIAHLAGGGPLLEPRTAGLMHAAANTPVPGLPSMALGFYHEDRNGRRIVGHGGDTTLFHSDLHLFLDHGVGLFMSFNSTGKDAASYTVRDQLFDGFTNRYFPAPPTSERTTGTARAHGEAMAGHYVSSRASGFNFLRLGAVLGQTGVTLNADDTITVSSLTDAAGMPKRWREIAPFRWREVGGRELLGAVLKDGRVAYFAPGAFAPIFEFVPAPASSDAGWVVPALAASLAVMLLAALAWPIVAIVRRRYGHRSDLAGRTLMLHQASRLTAWLMLAVAGGWMMILAAMSSDLAVLDGRLDPWMRLLQLLSILATIGAGLSVWNAYAAVTATGKRLLVKSWAVLVAVAALFLVWFVLTTGLVTASLNY